LLNCSHKLNGYIIRDHIKWLLVHVLVVSDLFLSLRNIYEKLERNIKNDKIIFFPILRINRNSLHAFLVIIKLRTKVQILAKKKKLQNKSF
jgi:hypothetical protein